MSDIAVVIVCRDLGRTLPETLESVAAQTRRAAETVVVDDGSTDLYTREVLVGLERAGAWVARAPGRSRPAARNLGIRSTASPYVVTLEADAVLHPACLRTTAARLDAEPALAFVAATLEAGGAVGDVRVPPPCDLVHLLARGAPGPATMVRRRVWEAVKGFDESLTEGLDDLDFLVSALELGFRGEVLPEPLLRRPVRSAAWRPGTPRHGALRRAMEIVLAKHRRTVEALGPELLLAKEAALLEGREYHRALERRKAELERELRGLGRQIAEAVRAVRASGKEPVEWGDLRRTAPFSALWGLDRGKPLDRHYIERFLAQHAADLRGRVLEVKDAAYAARFGASRVSRVDVLDIDPSNPRATIVADLTDARAVPSEAFDCFILAQTLHIIYDVRAALSHAYRILKPQGVLLCTLPCVSRVNFEDGGLDRGDYWRFTEASTRAVFAEFFPPENVEVTPVGNVMACAAFLYGLSPDELSPAELDPVDPWFPLLLCVRAVKPDRSAVSRSHADGVRGQARVPATSSGVVLAYHRIATLSPDPYGLCVSPAEFRAQMEHLCRYYRPFGLDELVRAAVAGRIPDGAVAVTLDDGYVDSLEVASPILEELGIPATFYVNTERLGEEHECWWDVLERVLSDPRVPPMLELQLGGEVTRFATGTAEERSAALRTLPGAVRSMARDERDEVVGRLLNWSGLRLPPRSTHRVLTDQEVWRLAQRPAHSIGAHTTHHLALPGLPPAVQREEVLGCKARLEHLLGRPILTFAYPYGQHSPKTVEIVREACFLAAVTVEQRPVRAGGDPMLVPRYEISAHDVERFASRLSEMFEGAQRTP